MICNDQPGPKLIQSTKQWLTTFTYLFTYSIHIILIMQWEAPVGLGISLISRLSVDLTCSLIREYKNCLSAFCFYTKRIEILINKKRNTHCRPYYRFTCRLKIQSFVVIYYVVSIVFVVSVMFYYRSVPSTVCIDPFKIKVHRNCFVKS